MKLMIAVPTTDYVHAEFMRCLVELNAHLIRQGIDVTTRIMGGTLVYIARNKIAQEAMENGYTHVLWLDSDMVFGTGILDDLMFCRKEMVCGAFVSRRPRYSACVYSCLNPVTRVEDFGTEPFRVAGCGFACVLTTVDLLRAVWNKFGTHFLPTTLFGEDLAFCERVTACGREIWCEPTVRPGHIAHIPVYAGEDTFGGLTR